MKNPLHLVTLLLLMGLVVACGKSEPTDPQGAQEDLSQVSAETAEQAGDVAAKKICCGGRCDAPAGTCCTDGTCYGNHEELPLAP